MSAQPRYALLFSTAVSALLLAGSAYADTTIHVSLWDKGPESMVMDDAHMGMMGKMDTSLMAMALMGVTLDQTSVPAGKITFDVVNDSKDIIHEFLVAPVTADQKELPYIVDENRVDEEAASYLGEVSELDPGKSGSLTVDLAAGSYIVFCNVPGHFINGMWSILTVTP